ncbi:MAG: hypothetical protein HC881_05505 [Leptolyngbyaceae cyanobacterium SL_7_1]|nr:hypothetical protein [Leptolyngbyaceae cyanobacterium SL_7_1]
MNDFSEHPDSPYLNNQQALQSLELEQQILIQCGCEVGAMVITEVGLFHCWALLNSLPPLSGVLQRLRKTYQIYLTLGKLLAEFEHQGVIITPRLPVPEHGSLDLLVRFPLPPKKVNFAIALRTKGHSKVVYHEQKDMLFLRRRGGLKRWEPDHLQRLPMQEFWLRNHQIELFGQSSKDKNRPLIKLLVLTGTATLGHHPDHLYAHVGNERVLLIRRRSSTYILQEQQLIPFIHAWLQE